ncbi:MAG TPA: alpha-glucan family phosphorylase [Rhodopila sp.]
MTPWRELPAALTALRELALDLRWTWSHEADALWAQAGGDLWQRTHNPWAILEDLTTARLDELAADKGFIKQLDALVAARNAYLGDPGWFAKTDSNAKLAGVAYFSMEFGVGEALPLYAGGLGILAGDALKAASDLGLPVIGIGLLYQEGYFHQMIDATGKQVEAYPYNDPSSMPISPARTPGDSWLHIPVELPGRTLRLRVWRVNVGRTLLYLLDSNDPANSPVDRGITGKLYGGGTEMRLLQEIALGVGGWRLVEALHPEIEVCHLNEGHAAFAMVERARSFAERTKIGFDEALWATRAGNVFTTHTPVEAGFDRFAPTLLARYGQAWAQNDAALADFVKLGLDQAVDPAGINMAYLAAHGAFLSFGVSRLHGAVSRRIFQPLFPRWPEQEVPFDHVTNGVHVPTWDSAMADAVWTGACGRERWRHEPRDMDERLEAIPDEALWTLRGQARAALIVTVRRRLASQLSGRGLSPEDVAVADSVLDPNVLTLGFARRFTGYKRPDLLLSDHDRLGRLLQDEACPVQIVLAGKAHPDDEVGKQMIQEWVRFAQDGRFRRRVVFLEDYDISLAQELVQGVDVWVNTPRRPWEACGTSGMKVVVNGGLNVSTLDGWWEEAYQPEVGWAIGDDHASANPDEQDHRDADELYTVLKDEVVAAFYDRDATGLPRAWVGRMRRSMIDLTRRFSASRMMRDYLEKAYLPAAQALRERVPDGAAAATAMVAWERDLRRDWPNIHVGDSTMTAQNDGWAISVPIYLGRIGIQAIRVEAYAQPLGDGAPEIIPLAHDGAIPGASSGYLYLGRIEGTRPAGDYTVRVVPSHPGVRVPAEVPLIRWQR